MSWASRRKPQPSLISAKSSSSVRPCRHPNRFFGRPAKASATFCPLRPLTRAAPGSSPFPAAFCKISSAVSRSISASGLRLTMRHSFGRLRRTSGPPDRMHHRYVGRVTADNYSCQPARQLELLQIVFASCRPAGGSGCVILAQLRRSRDYPIAAAFHHPVA